MKLNTHSGTPRPQNSRFIKALLLICAILIYSIFALGSFACFYYGKSIIGGISIICTPVFFTAIILLHVKDMEKAYIEICENEIYVTDYYWGIKKEKHFSFADITSAEICKGYSHRVKGYRLSFTGTQYIVFKKNNKYLFKIIHLPETESLFGSCLR